MARTQEKSKYNLIKYESKNDISPETKEKMIQLLQDRLSDGIDVTLQTKQAHWNIKGPHFIALHKLFDDVNEHMRHFVDLIAERIVQLGGIAEGTVQSVHQQTQVPPYPLQPLDETVHIDTLSHALSHFARTIRQSIDLAEQGRDIGTMDLFTEVSRGVDMDLWFVEAHIEGLIVAEAKKVAA